MYFFQENAFSSALGVLFVSVFSFMVINREPHDPFFDNDIIPSQDVVWENLFTGKIQDRTAFINRINEELKLTLLFDDIQVYYDLLKFEENDHDFRSLETKLGQYTDLKLWLLEKIKENAGKIHGLHDKIDRHQFLIDSLKSQYNQWKIDSILLIEIQQKIAKLENEKSWWEKEKSEIIQKCKDLSDLIRRLEIEINSIEGKLARMKRLDEDYDRCIIAVEEIAEEKESVQDLKDQETEKVKTAKAELDVIDLKIASNQKMLELARHMVKMCEHVSAVQRQKEEIARDYQVFSTNVENEVDNFSMEELNRQVRTFQSSHEDYYQKQQAQKFVNQVEDYFSEITTDLQGYENCKLEFNCDGQKCTFYIDQIAELTNAIADLKKEKNSKYYQIQLIEGEIKKLEVRIYELEKRIREQQSICNSLVNSMKNEDSDPSHIKFQILELRDKLTQKRNELQALLSQLRSLDCEHAVFHKQSELTDLISQEFQLRKKLQDLEKSINQSCWNCKKEVDQLRQRISHFDQTHQELRKREIELENRKNSLNLVSSISDCGRIHHE